MELISDLSNSSQRFTEASDMKNYRQRRVKLFVENLLDQTEFHQNRCRLFFLMPIINSIIITDILAEEWRKSVIVEFTKTGNSNVPENRRRLSHIFNRVLLKLYTRKQELILNFQSGSRPNSYTS